ncbi:MAG UNVERIFIED_CONTAM: hypothetical protein LVQ98_08020 [Rickettsiaceae bacterium]
MHLLGEKSFHESEQKELILKNFVASELTKHISILEAKYYLSHGLNNKKPGIDFIISNATNNKIVGINIKYR